MTKKWKRRNYLVNRSLQPRYMAMVAVLILIMSVLMGWIVYSTMWYTLSEMLEGDPMLYVKFRAMNMALLGRFLTVILLGSALAVLLMMFISHRIAGPLFRLERTIKEMGGGKIPVKVNLRKKDEFKQLAEVVNSVIRRMEEKAEKDRAVLTNVYRMLEEGAPPEKIKSELEMLELFDKDDAS